MCEPVVNDPAELSFNAAQQLQLQEALTQAISAPVAGTHAAEAGMAAERHKNACFHSYTTCREGEEPQMTRRRPDV